MNINPVTTETVSPVVKALMRIREERILKSNATVKPATKSDLIRAYATERRSASEIMTLLKEQGFSIYYSEIYRAMASVNVSSTTE